MLIYPDIDPVALQVGPVVIRWYALAYLVGIMLGWTYIRWLEGRKSVPLMTKEQFDDMVVWGVLGIILGGRMGYVLFYNFPYFAGHPQEILQLWHGGMSFHGGLIGIMLSFYLFSRKYKLSYLAVMDLIAAAGPIGLFFGRLANFVNGELFGRVTESPLGMVFPHGGPLPRHPSQLYEAGLEGLVLFSILFLLARYTKALERPGIIGGLFLAGYGMSRFIVEFFREPDAQLGYLALGLSMGQWLSIPMIAIGGTLVLTRLRRAA